MDIFDTFVQACSNGDYMNARASINDVDHHTQDELAFRQACANGHKNIAEWLWGLETLE